VAFTALRLEMGWQLNRFDSKALDNLMVGSVKQNVIEKAVEKNRPSQLIVNPDTKFHTLPSSQRPVKVGT
jgi:hypothetical protein